LEILRRIMWAVFRVEWEFLCQRNKLLGLPAVTKLDTGTALPGSRTPSLLGSTYSRLRDEQSESGRDGAIGPDDDDDHDDDVVRKVN